MTLYCKAGPDGKTIGDCPFCHAVRLVLEELHLDYELIPTTSETKPSWLLDFFEGKMPALRHGNSCYTESSVIIDYLLGLSHDQLSQANSNEATNAGLFPAIAKYLKHRPDNDEEDGNLRSDLKTILQRMNEHLAGKTFWNGESFTQTDCMIAPQLYHLQCGVAAFQKDIDLHEYGNLSRYMKNLFDRQSFRSTTYPAETVEWGWSNARK
jgi:glutathione S-transferase